MACEVIGPRPPWEATIQRDGCFILVLRWRTVIDAALTDDRICWSNQTLSRASGKLYPVPRFRAIQTYLSSLPLSERAERHSGVSRSLASSRVPAAGAVSCQISVSVVPVCAALMREVPTVVHVAGSRLVLHSTVPSTSPVMAERVKVKRKRSSEDGSGAML